MVALRVIADETVALDHLRGSVVRGMQKHVEIDEPEETHELELDPMLFGVAMPSVAVAEEADVEADDIEEEEESVIEEEALDDELAEDMLEVEEDADLADAPARDLPGDFDEEL